MYVIKIKTTVYFLFIVKRVNYANNTSNVH